MAGYSRWANLRHRLGALDKRPSGEAAGLRPQPRATQGRSVLYEGYGPGDVAVLVECVTADRRRTAAALRHLFRAHGSYLGADGSVAYLFNPVGLLTFAPGTAREPLVGLALEAGAEDVIVNEDGSIEVLTDPIELESVRAALSGAGFAAADVERTLRAWSAIKLSVSEAGELVRLLAALEGQDDVQSVYTNAEIPDEVLAGI